MKFLSGFILLSVLYRCTSADSAVNNEPPDIELGETKTEQARFDSSAIDSNEPVVFILVNTRFQNIVSSGNVISREFSEGLEVLELSNPQLVSPGDGIVSSKDSNHIQCTYWFYENARLNKYVLSLHNVESDYREGDTLMTDAIIGNVSINEGRYILGVDSWTDAPFGEYKWSITTLDSKKGFEDPSQIKNLIVVNKSDYHFYFYVDGQLKHDFEIALGQAPSGHKKEQGDNKTPEGRYLIVEKMKGPFDSPTGPWLGDSWFRLNYPNKWDAEIGFKAGLISEAQKNQITRAYNQKRDTPNNTKLGGHIGIHGWNGDWYQYGSHDITWGCVSMRNHQIDDIYDEIPVGTVVYIMP